MDKSVIPVEAIRERDIDLILLEELVVDAAFSNWFIQELRLPPLSKTDGAWRSITDFGIGETDILMSYFSEQNKILVLIENKLDAAFQDEQHIRYQKRATEYKYRSECSEAYAVLLAPEDYCHNQSFFKSYVTYEQISHRLESSGSLRGHFRSQLLQIAIEKLRRGYQPVNSEPVQKFWKDYWIYKELQYPSLSMKEPNVIPHNSDWPMLYHNDLPEVIFRHKLGQGNVDATFGSIEEVKRIEIQNLLPDHIKLVEHARTISLRIFTGELDRTLNFDDQVQVVDWGLQSITELSHWILNNRHLFNTSND